MKALLIIAGFLFAATAFGARVSVDKDSTWEEIQSANNVVLNGVNSKMLKYCQSGENQLRTKNKVTSWENVGTGRRDKWKKTKAYKYLPITFIEYTCHRKSCENNDTGDHTGMTPYEITRNLQGYIDVYFQSNKGWEKFLFSKFYSVPECMN